MFSPAGSALPAHQAVVGGSSVPVLFVFQEVQASVAALLSRSVLADLSLRSSPGLTCQDVGCPRQEFLSESALPSVYRIFDHRMAALPFAGPALQDSGELTSCLLFDPDVRRLVAAIAGPLFSESVRVDLNSFAMVVGKRRLLPEIFPERPSSDQSKSLRPCRRDVVPCRLQLKAIDLPSAIALRLVICPARWLPAF